MNLGRGPDGRRQRKYVYATTEAAVVQRMKKLNGREVDGQLLSTATPTVATFLEDWFATNTDTMAPEHAAQLPRAH